MPLRSMIRAGALVLAFAAAAPAFAATAPAVSASGGGDNPGSVGGLAPKPQTGEEVYKVVCQACHMADGKGGQGAGQIPALAANPRLAAAPYPLMMVLKGRGAMPWFEDSLSPAQVAGVVGYIRTHFGNNYPGPVTEADVKAMAGGK